MKYQKNLVSKKSTTTSSDSSAYPFSDHASERYSSPNRAEGSTHNNNLDI